MARTLLQLTDSSKIKLSMDPSVVSKIQQLIQQKLQGHPEMHDIGIRPGADPNNANYNFNRNEITSGSADPDILEHELGHAQNLQNSPMYQKLIAASRGVNELSKRLALPIMIGLRIFLKDEAKRQDILQTLAGLSAASAAPGLMEEASASANAVMGSGNRLETAGNLVGPLAKHTASDLIPALLLQIDRRL